MFNESDDWVRATAVHELAHIIDFNSFGVHGMHSVNGAALVKMGTYSMIFPKTTHVSDYAQSSILPGEYFAEAVAIAVYGVVGQNK
ncbi:MAG: hypothetical protein U0401_11225 [Anaerolineae bacterium]